MVKEAFADDAWRTAMNLTSANSINIGRLLPQMTYYAAASRWHLRRHGVMPNFIIPSGNLGNMMACVYARECGVPRSEERRVGKECRSRGLRNEEEVTVMTGEQS